MVSVVTGMLLFFVLCFIANNANDLLSVVCVILCSSLLLLSLQSRIPEPPNSVVFIYYRDTTKGDIQYLKQDVGKVEKLLWDQDIHTLEHLVTSGKYQGYHATLVENGVRRFGILPFVEAARSKYDGNL
jgi:hypothetical protein